MDASITPIDPRFNINLNNLTQKEVDIFKLIVNASWVKLEDGVRRIELPTEINKEITKRDIADFLLSIFWKL